MIATKCAVVFKKMRLELTAYLTDVSQVFFFRSALFGMGFLLLLLWFQPDFFRYGIIASAIAYGHTRLYSTPRILRDTGLVTVNGFFYGIAIACLYEPSPATQAVLVLGALVVPLAVKAMFEVLQHWKLNPFVFPYMLCILTLCLCGNGLAIERRWDYWPEFLSSLPSRHADWNFVQVALAAVAQGIGRTVFLPNPWFGAMVLVLVFSFSPRRGIFLLMGTLVGTLMAALLSTGVAWEYGLLSFSAGLVGLGLATRPERLNCFTILLFCGISSIITLALDQIFSGIGQPALSMPFVITMWIAVLSRSPRFNVSWGHSPNGAAR